MAKKAARKAKSSGKKAIGIRKTRKPSEMTVAQLERALERKRKTIQTLTKRRDRLAMALARVDTKLAAIGGTKATDGAKRKTRKRPKNEKPLHEVVIAVLGKNKDGLTLADLSQKVLDTGYKTNAAKFENTVYQTLYNNQDKIEHDKENRRYVLKSTSV